MRERLKFMIKVISEESVIFIIYVQGSEIY